MKKVEVKGWGCYGWAEWCIKKEVLHAGTGESRVEKLVPE